MAFTRRGPCSFETAAGYFEGKVNLLCLFFVLWVGLLSHVSNRGRFPWRKNLFVEFAQKGPSHMSSAVPSICLPSGLEDLQ